MAALRPQVMFVVPYAGPLLAGHVGAARPGSTGGAETQLFLLSQALAKRGHRIAMAVADVPAAVPDVVAGVEIVRLPPLRFGWHEAISFAIVTARRFDADAVVQRAAGSFTGLVGAPTRLRRRRFVYSSASDRDFDPDLLSHGILAPRLFKLGVRCADEIVVQTEVQAEMCRARWHREPSVIRSIAEPAPLRATDPDRFLWIGRINADKRPEAFLELASRLPQAQFQMIVSGSQDAELERIVRRRGAQLPNLEILGPQARGELEPLYHRAVAVLSTSVSEGMPNVLLEGWARGVPALVLSHDPDELVNGRDLGWAAGGSIERMVGLAESAWATRTNHRDLSQRCRAYIAGQHSPERIAGLWESVLGLSAPA